MEPAAAWGQPCEFQLASWSSAEEPGAHAWAPAGLPPVVQYAPTDIFGNTTYSHRSSSSIGQQQQLALYSYDYGAATQTQHGDQNAAAAAQEPSNDDAMRVFEDVTHAFEDEAQLVKLKMHRCPTAIVRALGKSYTVPRVVAIGPYHHDKEHLMAAEKVKHVAAHHCIKKSHRTVREVYDAVVSVADDGARDLYDEDVRTGISDDDFRHMMFFDACFLVQFMLTSTDAGSDPTLYDFLEYNENDILHDIMLLENQIPWQVVEAVMEFTPVPLGEVIAAWRGRLQVRMVVKGETAAAVKLDASYDPPHFLGFIRFYLVGSSDITETELGDKEKIEALSTSVSAIELAEMGINLRANQTTELAHMGLVNKMPAFFADLSMSPLSLDNIRASWLVNMAALELCTTPDFFDDEPEYEDSAVCSYLLLLCMLVHREEDVHQLRTKGILGGAGLTDKEALRFFTSLHSCLRLGCHYANVMVQIESYRIMRRIRIKVYAFVYKNLKIIIGLGSAIGAFVGILKTLKSLKDSHH